MTLLSWRAWTKLESFSVLAVLEFAAEAFGGFLFGTL